VETFTLKIYRAANSFLYLPTYIADELEIFNTALEAKDNVIKIDQKEYTLKVEFVDLDGTGDEEAINQMRKNNEDCSNNSIAIAIGSPVAFLKPRMTDEENNTRVVGAIINKLTFWAVDHQNKVYKTISDLKKNFSKVIYPNDKFVTGCYLGKIVKTEADISNADCIPVEFETEIPELIKINTAKKENRTEQSAIAITADIATLAQKTMGKDPALHINHYFSRSGDFLTTGIITTKSACDKYPDLITKIIEAIQKSIAILYSSEKTARKVCAVIADKKQFKQKFCDKVDENSDSIKEIITGFTLL
jgi:hypothetical protein